MRTAAAEGSTVRNGGTTTVASSRHESWEDESPARRSETHANHSRCHYLVRAAVPEALPTISLLPDTLPAAEHRTYQVFLGLA